MTPKQIELVQWSFIRLLPDSGVVAQVFYKRLFELDPSLRAMFGSDMKRQGKKRRWHYATVGQALIDTLSLGLGKEFTTEVSEAWLAAYTLLSKVMMESAADVGHLDFANAGSGR